MAYEVRVTPTARTTYFQILQFLIDNYDSGVAKKFENQVRHCVSLIANNPGMFEHIDEYNARRAVIDRYTSMFYEVKNFVIMVHLFWHNRRNPRDFKIEY